MVSEAAVTGGPLIATKLHAPLVRNLVPRPELLAELARGPRRLTLIRAPAGFGKSTLLAAWAESAGDGRFAWVGLDTGDNDPARFWTYAIQALRTVEPGVGGAALDLLGVPGTEVVDDVLPALVNELDELHAELVLALDDYHAIERAEIHEQLRFLVEFAPPGLQVALATRTEPPLALGRLRARGELVEIDVDRLRFGEHETEALVNGILRVGLDEADLARVRRRTEGWVAGLYLAALSLRGAEDRGAFLARFAGDDRHVVDYLSAEVLAAQPEPVRAFLLRTSILDRFSAPLCAAVAGVEDAQARLREIERRSLFLVPLDSTRTWYRYHHLFQELLRLELAHSEPALVPELHRRAASWLLEADLVSEAIEHTLAAGDADVAAELVCGHWASMLLGEAGDRIVARWLSSLPDEIVRADFRLCFAAAFIALSLGRMDDVARWLAAAEQAEPRGPLLEGLTSREGGLACVRAAYLWESGDAGGSLNAGHGVLATEPEGAPWRAIGVACVGLGHMARGEWAEGLPFVDEYARIGRESGHHLNHASGLGSVACCHAGLGDWGRAAEAASRSLAIGDAHGITEHWCMAHAHLARGLCVERCGDLAAAQESLERAAELVRRGYGPTSTTWILTQLARVLHARGDGEGAAAALAEAREAAASAADVGVFAERVADAERRLGVRAAPPAEPGDALSERELQVLRLLATALSQREIGRELYVSLNTIKTHSRSIFRKLGASGRAEAVARARELGLL